MITVKKGKRTQSLHNDVQVAAFAANGWKVVETKGKPAEQNESNQDESTRDESTE